MQLISLYFSFFFYCLFFNRPAIAWMIPLALLVLPIYDIFTHTYILNLKSIHHLCWLLCKDLIHCLHTETCRRHIPAWWPLRLCASRGRACRCVRRCPVNTVSWANLPINKPRFVSTIIITVRSIGNIISYTRLLPLTGAFRNAPLKWERTSYNKTSAGSDYYMVLTFVFDLVFRSSRIQPTYIGLRLVNF